ncbi:MAG: hypothetical protein J7K98_03050 [Candidatus Aenigmarchaeota archaeon]|nr:hypothetical protein [Candidatus Aenigmarchaeota archaeon]
MKVWFVTSNKGKVKEVMPVFEEYGIDVKIASVEIDEIKTFDQRKLTLRKLEDAMKITKKPTIVEDTGIYFKVYKNFPGTVSKFVFHAIGYEGIFKLLEGKDRHAYFRTVVAFGVPKEKPVMFEGKCFGIITKKVLGKIDRKLPYDSIFIPKGDSRTFSQMTKREKAKYSHRVKAFKKLARWLVKRYG